VLTERQVWAVHTGFLGNLVGMVGMAAPEFPAGLAEQEILPSPARLVPILQIPLLRPADKAVAGVLAAMAGMEAVVVP